MSFFNLFYFSYWFSQPLTARGAVMWAWVGGFLAIVLFGLVMQILRLYQKQKWSKEISRRFGNWGVNMGLWGLLWMFFRQERIAFLAWRFWVIIWLVVTAIWLYRLLYYVIKRVPKIKEEEAVKELKNKYLV